MPAPVLSLILPALNQARRLPPYLQSVRGYLERSFRQSYEVIVVDDGSGDETAAVVQGLAAQWPQLRLLRHDKNEGKGSAVRTGVLAARGELLLFADADGAAPIEEHARLAAAIAQGADVAIGSRLLPDPAIRRTRHWYRELLGRLFALAARRLLRISARDTQCGFKMFRARPLAVCSRPSRKPATCSTWSFWSWPSASVCGWWKCRSTGRKCRAGTSIRSASCRGSSPDFGGCGDGDGPQDLSYDRNSKQINLKSSFLNADGGF